MIYKTNSIGALENAIARGNEYAIFLFIASFLGTIVELLGNPESQGTSYLVVPIFDRENIPEDPLKEIRDMSESGTVVLKEFMDNSKIWNYEAKILIISKIGEKVFKKFYDSVYSKFYIYFRSLKTLNSHEAQRDTRLDLMKLIVVSSKQQKKPGYDQSISDWISKVEERFFSSNYLMLLTKNMICSVDGLISEKSDIEIISMVNKLKFSPDIFYELGNMSVFLGTALCPEIIEFATEPGNEGLEMEHLELGSTITTVSIQY